VEGASRGLPEIAAAVEQTSESVVVTDVAARILYVNPAFERVTGCSRAEVAGLNPRILQGGVHAPGFYEAMWARLVAGETWSGEFINRRKDGSLYVEMASISPVRDESGEVAAYVAVKRDVTAERQAAEVLRASEARYRAVADSATDAIVSADDHGRLIGWNASAAAIFGYSEEEAIGRSVTMIMPDRDASAHPGWTERFRNDGEPRVLGRVVELEGRRRDGTHIPIELSLSHWEVSGERFFTAIIRDVTVRKEAEKTLRESEALQRAVLDVLTAGVVVQDPEGNVLMTNPSATEILGVDPDELRIRPLTDPSWRACKGDGTPFSEADHPARIALDTGLPIRNVVMGIVRPDGMRVWLRVNAEPISDDTGSVIAVVKSFADVTERRERAEALRQSADLLEASQAMAHVGGWELDVTSGDFTWSNEMYRLFDTSREEFKPTVESVTAFYSPASAAASNVALARALEHGEPIDFEVDLTTARGRRAMGHVLGHEIVTDGRVAKVTGTFQDITERRDLEGRLRQAQKMEAVGQLAGGIAHDFNNLLTAIRGYGELALSELGPGSAIGRDVAEMLKAADRAAGMTRQLLAFSRRQVLEPQIVNPWAVVDEIAPMLRRLLGEHIELITRCPPDLGRVHVDPSQLEQVIVNLAVNSRDAMPGGGRLTLSMRNVMVDGARDHGHPALPPGPYVRIKVKDTGTGMDRATLSPDPPMSRH
jgi:PAS domain S-box-containing protein